ncbi:hypothetical protein PF005_g19179 [Phytophthora fragariae]|uniref:Secreted protein n=2 Tax=Phytophthora TaxID=4783 RepID=A0A6A3E8N3_9STRA|nr:hypothetical protein PF003_g11472 [Phytophthora fragariae]KAE9011129.1 hypothetical protein PR002_g15174 [Phytophthora rubi]KAE8930179.1 hypothetical protein PF009_g19722 [Phytophthora fragariae]KAE8982668.1 hypothetical protein PF011_g21521 [Phytophthora fragariae]KAE9081211.1 hypothetical protein PF007_g22755 [Phytophthora fragariae]
MRRLSRLLCSLPWHNVALTLELLVPSEHGSSTDTENATDALTGHPVGVVKNHCSPSKFRCIHLAFFTSAFVQTRLTVLTRLLTTGRAPSAFTPTLHVLKT